VAIKAGLSPFASSSFEVSADPFQPFELPVDKGFGSPKLDAVIQGTLGRPTVTDSLAQSRTPRAAQAYENAEGKIFVNGLMFDADDHTKMLESEQYLNAPEVNRPTGPGWRALDRNAYQAKIDSIKDPSLGTLASKNFGIGVDNLQLLGGYGLELMRAEETGRAVQEQQLEDLAKSEPYQREFSEDVESVETGIDWFVANLAQQGPNMIESLATFVLGYTAGGGQITGLGSGIAAVAGKESFKKALKTAIKNRTKAKDEGKPFKSLSAADQKILRQTSGISAVMANNYAIGASDIFGEVKDTDPEGARLKAFFGAIPYMLFETAPEALLASRLLGGVRGKGNIARRFGTGALIGAGAEGSTEAAQEALLMGLNPEASITSPEGKKRLLNAFAAGAGVGAPVGGLANLARNKVDLSGNNEVDLIKEKTPEPTAPIEGEQLDIDFIQPLLDERAEQVDVIANNTEALEAFEKGLEARDDGEIARLKTEVLRAEQRVAEIDAELGAPSEPMVGPTVQSTEQDNAFPDVWQQQAEQDPRADSTTPVFEVADEQMDLFPDAEPTFPLEQQLPDKTVEPTPAEIEQQNELQRQVLAKRNAEARQQQAEVEAREREELQRRQRAEQARVQENHLQALLRARTEAYEREQQAKEAAREASVAKYPEYADEQARIANIQRSQEEYEKATTPKLKTPEPPKISAGEKAWNDLRPDSAKDIDYDMIPDHIRDTWEQYVNEGKANKTTAGLLAKQLTKESLKTKATKATDKLAKVLKEIKDKASKEKIAAVGSLSGGKPKAKKQKPEDDDDEEDKLKVKKVAIQADLFPDTEEPTVKFTPKDLAQRDTLKTRAEQKAASKAKAKGNPILTEAGKVRSSINKLAKGKSAITGRAKALDTANKADPITKKQKLKSKQAIGDMYARVRPEGSTVRYSKLDADTRAEFDKAYLDSKLTEELINDIDKRGAKSIEAEEAMAKAQAKDKAKLEEIKQAEVEEAKEAARLKDEVERVYLAGRSPYFEFIKVSFADFLDSVSDAAAKSFKEDVAEGYADSVQSKRQIVDEALASQGKVPRLITEAVAAAELGLTGLFEEKVHAIIRYSYIRKGMSHPTGKLLEGPKFIDYMLNNLKVAQVKRDIVADALREIAIDNPIPKKPLFEDHPIVKIEGLTWSDKQRAELDERWAAQDKKEAAKEKPKAPPKVERTKTESVVDQIISKLDRIQQSGLSLRAAKTFDAAEKEVNELFAELDSTAKRTTWNGYPLKDWFSEGELNTYKSSRISSEGVKVQRRYPKSPKTDTLIKAGEGNFADKARRVNKIDTPEKRRARDKIDKRIFAAEQSVTKLKRDLTRQNKLKQDKTKLEINALRKRIAADKKKLEKKRSDLRNDQQEQFDKEDFKPNETLDSVLDEARKMAEAAEIAAARVEGVLGDFDSRHYDASLEYSSDDDYSGDIQFFSEDGKILEGNLGLGQVEVAAINFVNGLKTTLKPTIKVYRSTAAFKQMNKTLFARAKATGKFSDDTKVMAFHMGNTVVLFSDFIKTDKQVKTILAHEVLGHHGLRTVVPKAKLTRVLDDIYNTDANIRNIVDHQVDIHGVDKYVAIEEAIADKAMILETSLLNKIWTLIKNMLNKVGLKFGDEMSRYWVGNIRRFIRYGQNDGTFDVEDISQALKDMKARGDTIRFMSQENNAQLGSDFIAMNAQNRIDTITGGMGGIKDYIQSNAVQDVLKKAGGIKAAIGSVFEALQTLNHKATRSKGLTDLYGLFVAVSNASKDYLNHYQLKTKTQYSADGFTPLATKEEKLQAGELLSYLSIFKGKQVTDSVLNRIGDLVSYDESGNVQINEDVLKQQQAHADISLAELRKGIKVAEDGSIWGTKESAPWLHDKSFTEDHVVWQMYKENRSATDQAALDVLVAEIKSAFSEKVAYIDDLRRIRGGLNTNLDSTDTQFFHDVFREYIKMRRVDSKVTEGALKLDKESKAKAEEFLYAITRGMYKQHVDGKYVPKKLKDIKESVEHGTGEHGDLFKGRTDILERVQAIHDKLLTKKQAELVQHAIQKLFITDNHIQNVQINTKRTIMGSYVQLVRDAKYQVRMQAYLYENGKRGAPVSLDESLAAQMPYYQVESKEEARKIVKFLGETLSSTEGGDTRVVEVTDSEGQQRFITLVPQWGAAAKQSPSSGSVSYRDIAGLLIRLDINLTPQQQERIVTATARFEAQARKHLMRTGNPGWDKNVLKHIASYLETRAHVAAKSEYRYTIERLMADSSKWTGDRKLLHKLANEVTEASKSGNEEAKFIAKQRFDTYAYMYRYSADVNESGFETVKVDGKEIKLELMGQGRQLQDEGKKLLAWYGQTRNIVTSTEDILSGALSSKLKLATVTMQLGMSFATAAVNLTSIPLLTIPSLTYYNKQRGFGGGFGFSKASVAVHRAVLDIWKPKFGETEFLYDMVKNWKEVNGSKKYNKYGITLDEAKFLLEETEKGTMAPAQMNALLGSSRGGVQGARVIKGITAWMYPFSQTEQLNRRVSGLAAYRLERDRYMAANKKEFVDAETVTYARDKAGQFVYDSQGNYDMYNRPEIARGNIFQYPMMYKQFTLSAIKLLMQMDKKGKRYFLGLLFLVAGMKGMPFADDIMDLIDTLAQFFGLRVSTVEKVALEIVEDIAPGFGPIFMRGGVDRLFGGTVSTRLGFGDLFPLTGAFKAGADPWREAENAFGPVWTTAKGILGTAAQTSKWGLESVGLRKGHTSLMTVAREAPITTLRAITDGYTYYDTGLITNAQGKVVSRDATLWTAITRMLGFYPSVATAENDIVRMAKQTSDYAKDIKTEFRSAYIKAKISGDTEEVNRVVKAVQEWNVATKGTEFYIRQFTKSANKAYREWSRTTSERYLKSAPKTIRPETKWLMDVFVND